MKTGTCHECGAAPCFLICPMADPFHGDQCAEDAAYEEGSRYTAAACERFSADSEDES